MGKWQLPPATVWGTSADFGRQSWARMRRPEAQVTRSSVDAIYEDMSHALSFLAANQQISQIVVRVDRGRLCHIHFQRGNRLPQHLDIRVRMKITVAIRIPSPNLL